MDAVAQTLSSVLHVAEIARVRLGHIIAVALNLIPQAVAQSLVPKISGVSTNAVRRLSEISPHAARDAKMAMAPTAQIAAQGLVPKTRGVSTFAVTRLSEISPHAAKIAKLVMKNTAQVANGNYLSRYP